MRKAIKFCLALAMVGTMALPALAAEKDVTVGGRVWTTLEQSSVKPKDGDAQTVLDHKSGTARVNVSGSMKGDVWSSSAFVEMQIAPGSSFSGRDANVTVENDAIAITAGRKYWFGNQQAGGYLYGYVADTLMWGGQFYGYAMNEVRPNGIKVALKDVGLGVALIIDGNRADDDASGDSKVHKEQTIYATYSGTFGDISLGASYLSAAFSVDEKQSGTAGKDSEWDGTSLTGMNVSVLYTMGDMGFGLGYDTNTRKPKEGDDYVQTNTQLIFDMKLDDTSGVSIGYDMQTAADGSSNDEAQTGLYANYKTEVGGALIIAEFGQYTAKDDDDALDTSTQKVGATLRYNF